MEKLSKQFPFRITLQTTYRAAEERTSFEALLAQLQQLGFYGIELNLPDLTLISPDDLTALLDRYHLVLTYLATGAYAKTNGYSLSTADNALRERSIQGCVDNIEYAAKAGAGVILGFLKGGPGDIPEAAEARLTDSIGQICQRTKADVPVLLEVTNRSESSCACTLREAEQIVTAIRDPRLYILPDTYHMAVGKTDTMEDVSRLHSYVRNIHLSDDTRFLPGLGNLDFSNIVGALKDMGYQGTCGLEGNIRDSLSADLAASAAYLCRVGTGISG